MVRLDGETSNTLADELFETLEDWNTYLKAEKIDFEKLSQGSKKQPNLKQVHGSETPPKKPKQQKRHHMRSPSP